jgi:hypothetical protein
MNEYTFIYMDGFISRHNTLDGMVEMLLPELLEEDDYERELKSYEGGNWSDKRKIDFITMFDIEVVKK